MDVGDSASDLHATPAPRPAEIEEAEIDAAFAEHEAWKAAGRPGGTVSHEAAMAELLGGD